MTPDEPASSPAIDPEYHANCERRARLAERELVEIRAALSKETRTREDFEREVEHLRVELTKINGRAFITP
jgi:hypothetical protein